MPVINTADLLVGSWTRPTVIIDPTNSSGLFQRIHLGDAPEGVLTVEREQFNIEDTSFPKLVAATFDSRISVTFAAEFAEFNAITLNTALGNAPTEGGDYIQFVSGCLARENFFGFEVRRDRCSDLGAGFIVARLHKAQVGGTFTIASADEQVTMPITFTAVDDTEGNYGGSPTSPLGYLYVPGNLGS
jgi:hypothetical protein